MKLLTVIFIILGVIESGSCAQKVLGVAPERASLYDSSKPFSCLDGSNSIPFEQVNDDYCDCRDGSDEPGTSACLNGQFACENIGYIVQMIPSGRVNDRICDCCDGSDESNSEGLVCPNTCNVLATKMRAEEERLKLLTDQGVTKKKELIEQGNLLKQSIQDSINSLQSQRATLEIERQKLEEVKKEAETKANTAKAAQDLIFEEKKAELKKLEESKKAKVLFELLDLNKDSFLSPDELVSHTELDTLFDNDGSFTLEEATQLLDDNNQVTEEVFSSQYYEKISPHLIQGGENTSTEAPLEEGEGDENLEDHEEHEEEEIDVTEPPTTIENLEFKYDDETQRLIDEFEAVKSQFDTVDSTFQNTERDIKEKEAQLQLDVGSENEFASMIDVCFDFDEREYIYKLCPFSKAVQRSKNNNADTSIGTWSSWGPEENNKSRYMMMKFTNGLACWNGPQRSTTVHLTCGLENKVISVSEPNKCEYEMKFETPAVCSEVIPSAHDHEEL